MSATLKWRPIDSGRVLPYPLRAVMEKRFSSWPLRVGECWKSYFEGLADAGIEGAAEVLGLLAIHEEIELWLDY